MAATDKVPNANTTQVPDVNSGGYEKMISLSDIIVDEDFNARDKSNYSAQDSELDTKNKEARHSTEQGSTQLNELAQSLARQGQQQSVLLRPMKNGKFFLVAGFRRVAAAKILGWNTIRAFVKEMTDKEAALHNLTENLARKNLKPYEVARKCKDLRGQYGMTLEEIGKDLAFSKSYVGFLTKIIDKSAPKLWTYWTKGKYPGVLTVDNLYSWSSLSETEQMERFYDEIGKGKKVYDEDGNIVILSDEDKKLRAEQAKAEKLGKITPPKKEHIENALSRVTGGIKGHTKEYCAGAMDVLRWILAETETCGDWYNPKTESETEKANALVKKATEALEKAKKLAATKRGEASA